MSLLWPHSPIPNPSPARLRSFGASDGQGGGRETIGKISLPLRGREKGWGRNAHKKNDVPLGKGLGDVGAGASVRLHPRTELLEELLEGTARLVERLVEHFHFAIAQLERRRNILTGIRLDRGRPQFLDALQ